MSYIVLFSIAASFFAVAAIRCFLYCGCKVRKTVLLFLIIFSVGVALLPAVDSFTVLYASNSDYELPTKVGRISEVKINTAPAARSTLMVDGETYAAPLELTEGHCYHPQCSYRITYTPLTRMIVSIEDVSDSMIESAK